MFFLDGLIPFSFLPKDGIFFRKHQNLSSIKTLLSFHISFKHSSYRGLINIIASLIFFIDCYRLVIIKKNYMLVLP